MSNKETRQRADNVRNYLKGIGREISSTQAHEVVARAQGYKNKHTLASAAVVSDVTDVPRQTDAPAATPKIFGIGERHFSARALAERGLHIDVVVPVEKSIQGEDIDYLNDHVSEMITGGLGLKDIGYMVYPHFYDKDHVAMRVSGYVDLSGIDIDEVGIALLCQIQEKRQLARALCAGTRLELTPRMFEPQEVVIGVVDSALVVAVGCTAELVTEENTVDDQWSTLRNRTVLSVASRDVGLEEYRLDITFEQLVFAHFSDGAWHVDMNTDEGSVTYQFKVL